jgi:hypothetical protein
MMMVTDPCDRLLHSDVLELDGRLERAGSGLATQRGQARPGIDYFASPSEDLVGFVRAYLGESVPKLLMDASDGGVRPPIHDPRVDFSTAVKCAGDRLPLVGDVLDECEELLGGGKNGDSGSLVP